MASRPYSNSPWPSPTPDIPSTHPPPPAVTSDGYVEGRSMKRRRLHSAQVLEARRDGLVARQIVAEQALIEQARRDCQLLSGNEIISCFPTAGISIPQHQWATFVWNSRRPELTQFNRVNIYLFRADSRQEVLRFMDRPNPTDQAGVVTARVDDRWFGRDGERWEEGRNISYPFYWVITRSDEELNGNEIPQSTFSAIQTTYADSVSASRSSASVASASSASAISASLSSASAASMWSLTATRITTISGTPTTLTGTLAFPTGNVQEDAGSDSFPRWAIAVIVVLGFLAIAATCILAFLILRRIRRRNQSELDSHRNSMGSASPMMANAAQQPSPVIAPTILPTVRRPDSLRRNDSHDRGGGQNAPSVVLHDGESGVSGEGGPFSGADAAIMADAFRKMLRKPDFAAVDEGESPDSANDPGGPAGGQHMLSRELAEEGRDIRSVGSSRGVRVESLSDAERPRDSHHPS
ncbi:hypothetical protein CC1G_05024 [Coprinopsis cinerea okayama7|uniref:Uncharacterized protein n=1 Tax=Coprinopsis cinerea (strain Okayama-7 / 130 / ATCC MYA-4618 / FGSC 9003) TaxID=240176 RepID=A8NSK4_COPC7|nr:hypothetical protein CC1G_05024 [Coprinopsis cinerea okayama7\|eukprot:XP_001836031.2 hypothetical protein CC1G_05024 [Coprinopsis cinerea okayama7\